MTKKRNNTSKRSKRVAKHKKKAVYRVKNWAAYNDSLVQRGALTVWISDEVLEDWHPEPKGPRQRGGQGQYSARAIECLLVLKTVFNVMDGSVKEMQQLQEKD